MENRIWYELCQRKHDHYYCLLLLSKYRNKLRLFNILILLFSTGGVMGWRIWDDFPTVACVIISGISILRLLSPHIIPSEKQIDKLNDVVNFQFDYYNKIEQLWYDYFNRRITDIEAQNKFYELKNTEREINNTINEYIKSINRKLKLEAKIKSDIYLKQTFNT